jgi:Kef-type K+ transport system membrane component KefB
MSISENLLLAMFVIFALPWAVWRALGGTFIVPLVVVQIIAGVLLGPGVLGAWSPDIYNGLFRVEVIAGINAVAQWAVIVFVFVAGLELDVTDAWKKRRETSLAAGLALVVPLVFGTLVGWGMVQSPGWVGDKGQVWQTVLGIGMACAVTALPILVLFLGQLGLLRQPLGQRILRYASLDDVAIWAVMALILLDWHRLGLQLGYVVIFPIAALAMRWLFPRLRESDRWYLGLIWLAANAFIADWAGLHFMVGAFLSGAVLDARWFDHKKVDDFHAAILVALMPIYFLSTGLRTNWDLGGPMVFVAAGVLLVAAVAGKLVGVHIAGRILGWRRADTWAIGWLLQTKALIMIIFANILLEKGIISAATFTALLLMAVASTLLTMPILTWLLQGAGHKAHR